MIPFTLPLNTENEDFPDIDMDDRLDDYVPSKSAILVCCSQCNGSGEGMYEGTTCHNCGGKGEVWEEPDNLSFDDEENGD